MKSKWISVKDKLPDTEELVLIFDNQLLVSTGWLSRNDGSKWYLHLYDGNIYEGQISTYDVTYWMPFPEQPEAE